MNEAPLWLAIGLVLGISMMPRSYVPSTPEQIKAAEERLAAYKFKRVEEIKEYCQRYQKEPYISNCVADRSKRNFVK